MHTEGKLRQKRLKIGSESSKGKKIIKDSTGKFSPKGLGKNNRKRDTVIKANVINSHVTHCESWQAGHNATQEVRANKSGLESIRKANNG